MDSMIKTNELYICLLENSTNLSSPRARMHSYYINKHTCITSLVYNISMRTILTMNVYGTRLPDNTLTSCICTCMCV